MNTSRKTPKRSHGAEPYAQTTAAPDSTTLPAALHPNTTHVPLHHTRGDAVPAQTQAWAAFLNTAVHNGLDPTLVTQWLTVLADATGSPVLSHLGSMALADYVDRRLTVILAGLESTTHSPYLAGLRLRILPDLGHLPVGLITTGMIQDAVYAWIADGCGRSTVKSTLAMLHRILRQAVADGLIANESARVTGRQHELLEPRALALRDWDALTELADALVNASYNHYGGWGDAIVHSACTATRIGEVSGVRVEDIDTEQWILTCRHQTTPAPGGLVDKAPKGGHTRHIPVIEPLRPQILRRLHATRGDPDARLYTGPRGGRITTAVLRDATHWDEVVHTLGHTHLRRHDLRHTGLTWMADAGVPPHILQEIAGHRDFDTTVRYLHPDLRTIAEAGDTLTRHLLEQLRRSGRIPRRW
ncbi:tyrosine-type recombinase/integrase [Kitasatospora sp. NPDC048407]|uniref:tyrosine-type recombinase/integrase n=1 Tax=Kitasatospora sp. NPDC048407 TaxID=3364051 RepID=UPI003712F5A5